MTIDDPIREVLARRVSGVRARDDAWERLEHRLRDDSHPMRVRAVAALILIGFGASLLVLWRAFQPRMETPVKKNEAAFSTPHIPYISGSTLVGYPAGPVQLRGSVGCCLTGWLTPAATSEPEGSRVAYSTWEERGKGGIPSIRILELDTGRDWLLQEGAFSVAWRNDGVFGYFRGERQLFEPSTDPYDGHIEVRPSVAGDPVTWTNEPGRYFAVAWAGRTLLAYQMFEGEHVDLLAIDGPGQVRVLRDGATLVALSPDGSLAAVDFTEDPRYLNGLEVIEVASGRTIARLTDPFVGYSGSWTGDRIVASGEGALQIFKFDGEDLALEATIAISKELFGPYEPVPVDSAGNEIFAWATRRNRSYVYVECSVPDRQCIQSPFQEENLRPVRNPSRPT